MSTYTPGEKKNLRNITRQLAKETKSLNDYGPARRTHEGPLRFGPGISFEDVRGVRTLRFGALNRDLQFKHDGEALMQKCELLLNSGAKTARDRPASLEDVFPSTPHGPSDDGFMTHRGRLETLTGTSKGPEIKISVPSSAPSALDGMGTAADDTFLTSIPYESARASTAAPNNTLVRKQETLEDVLTASQWARLQKTTAEKDYSFKPVVFVEQPSHSSFLPVLRDSDPLRTKIRKRKPEVRAPTPKQKRNQTGSSSDSRALELVMLMEPETMDLLHDDFEEHDNNLAVDQFVDIMLTHLPHAPEEEKTLSAGLVDLFAQVDVNGDGSMEWEELTTFIIECGRVQKSVNSQDILSEYLPAPVQDRHSRGAGIFIDRLVPVGFNDSPNLLAAFHEDSPIVNLYNAADCSLAKSIVGHKGQALAAVSVEEYGYIVTSSTDRTLMFWDGVEFFLRQRFPSTECLSALCWNKNQNVMYTGSMEGRLSVLDIVNLEYRGTMAMPGKDNRAHGDIIPALTMLGESDVLASCSLDASIVLWDAVNLTPKISLVGHRKGVLFLSYNSDYRYMVSAGHEHSFRVWNPNLKKPLFTLGGHNSALCGIVTVPNSPRIVTASVDGSVRIWDCRNFQCVQEIYVPPNGQVPGLRALAHIDSLGYVVAASAKRLNFYAYDTKVDTSLTDSLPIVAAIYNPTSTSVITAAGHDIKIWDAKTGICMKKFHGLTRTEITSLVLDSRERKFIVGESSGVIKVYNYLNGAVMKELDAHSADVVALIYSSDDKCVISCSWDRRVCVHDETDPEVGIVVRTMLGHRTDVISGAFSKQWRLTASGSADGAIRVWDFEMGNHDGTCSYHTTEITALTFFQKYPILCSADFVGVLCLWPVRPYPSSRYSLIQKFRNVAANEDGTGLDIGGDSVAVLTMEFYEAGRLLYTGDEQGCIKSWDMSLLFSEMRMEDWCRHNQFPQVRPPRRGQFLASDMKVKTAVKSGFSASPRVKDGVTPVIGRRAESAFGKMATIQQSVKTMKSSQMTSVTCAHVWKAHSEPIKCLQIVLETKCILSGGLDCKVKLWTLKGEALGTLTRDESPKDWNFPLDVDEKQRKVVREATEHLRALRESRAAALASQQVLRRNDKTDYSELLRQSQKKHAEEEKRSAGPLPLPNKLLVAATAVVAAERLVRSPKQNASHQHGHAHTKPPGKQEHKHQSHAQRPPQHQPQHQPKPPSAPSGHDPASRQRFARPLTRPSAEG